MSDRPLHLVPIGRPLGEHRASSLCPCHPTEAYRDLQSMRLAYVHRDEAVFSTPHVNTRAVDKISPPEPTEAGVGPQAPKVGGASVGLLVRDLPAVRQRRVLRRCRPDARATGPAAIW